MKTLALVLMIVLISMPVYAGSKGGTGSRGSYSTLSSHNGKLVPASSYKTQNVYNDHGQLQQEIKKDSSGNQNVYNQHGQLQQVIKKDSSGNLNVYNQHGQLQEVIKKDSSGNQNIYNQHGQLQNVIKRDSSGTQNVYDEHGQLQDYIKPNGVIIDLHGQEPVRIRPGN